MAKYLVLFKGDGIPEADINSGDTTFLVPEGMYFGYQEERDGWTFDSAAAAHKEAKDNDYEPDDYIVVRVLK